MSTRLWQFRFLLVAAVLLSLTFFFRCTTVGPRQQGALSPTLSRVHRDRTQRQPLQTAGESDDYRSSDSGSRTQAVLKSSPPDGSGMPTGEQVYSENGIALKSYTMPFHCDVQHLPGQLRMATLDSGRYVNLVHGHDDFVSDGIYAGGWEAPITWAMHKYMKAIAALEKGRDGYMDLGTNIGAHALHFAAYNYAVHMFEPTFINHLLTRCSLSIGTQRPRVRLNTFGIGKEAAKVCMGWETFNMGGSEVKLTNTKCDWKHEARIGTLDAYYAKHIHKKQKFAVLKMDIQGFETFATEGGKAFFDSEEAPPAIFFEYDPGLVIDKGGKPLDLPKFFLDRDYSIYRGRAGNTTALAFEDFPEDTRVSRRADDQDLVAISNTWISKLEDAGYTFDGPRIYEPEEK